MRSVPKVPRATWRDIFGFSSVRGHPGLLNVQQAYYRRLLEGPILMSHEDFVRMLDKALADAEVALHQPKNLYASVPPDQRCDPLNDHRSPG